MKQQAQPWRVQGLSHLSVSPALAQPQGYIILTACLFIEGLIEAIFNCPGSAGQETEAQERERPDLSSG